jgi:hypothetical protein
LCHDIKFYVFSSIKKQKKNEPKIYVVQFYPWPNIISFFRTWMDLPRLPVARANHGCGTFPRNGNLSLVIFGGADQPFPDLDVDSYIDNILFLDLANLAKGWYTITGMWLGGRNWYVKATVITRCQFHQHFTCAFFVQKCLRSFSLVTVWLCNFWSKEIGAKAAHKMLMKLTTDWTRLVVISALWRGTGYKLLLV